MGVFNKIGTYIYYCAKLNFYTIYGILSGGIILGIAPSLIAAGVEVYRLSRKEELNFSRFKINTKKYFTEANKHILPLITVAFVLLVIYRMVLNGWLELVYLFLIGYTIVLIWIMVAMNSYYERLQGSLLKIAMRFCLCQFPIVVLLFLENIALFYLAVIIPGLIPFFMFGLSILVNVLTCYSFFAINEKQLEEDKK
ncbi:DUF624 domain-containing protein [Streptococcus merionis]|uniref:Predicted integral membrane protein n=1 Tax=Streptococcus merionis TaxID=400065 RepID=A0A239SPH0_9STRE|nr:DUF624 domain-containing protein [Streptococcus merionis]SNU86543.1 Predicted integral membrane protein [Streptococcus merionis]